MLQVITTNSGVGILLQGDYEDISYLYDTVHECISVLQKGTDKTTSESEILLNFAYELRKSKQRQRIMTQLVGYDTPVPYYGCQFIWTDIFAFIIALQPFLYSKHLNDVQKATLVMFKAGVELALKNYDVLSYKRVKNMLQLIPTTSTPYSFLAYQDLHIQFLELKPGIQRTRLLHALLYSRYIADSKESKLFAKSMNAIAKDRKCDVSDLGYEEFPDVEW